MKKNKPIIKDKERTILRYIDENGGNCTPHEIAKATGLSYMTVRKYLDKLIKMKVLEVEDGEE